MAFTLQQTAALRAKLRRRHVKTRMLNGSPLAFLEGWHVIAEANRIFGYDCWDRRTLAPRCVWSAPSSNGQTAVIYTTTVRITVRAGGSVVMRDGIGTGFGRAAAAEIAHEIAVKAAETDATKRALATFGNPFGLRQAAEKCDRGTLRPNPQGRPCCATACRAADLRAAHIGWQKSDLRPRTRVACCSS